MNRRELPVWDFLKSKKVPLGRNIVDNGGKMTILDEEIKWFTDRGVHITPTYSVKYGKGYDLNTGTKAGCCVFMKDARLVFIRGGQAFVIENDEDGFPPNLFYEIRHQVRLSVGVGETLSDNWEVLR